MNNFCKVICHCTCKFTTIALDPFWIRNPDPSLDSDSGSGSWNFRIFGKPGSNWCPKKYILSLSLLKLSQWRAVPRWAHVLLKSLHSQACHLPRSSGALPSTIHLHQTDRLNGSNLTLVNLSPVALFPWGKWYAHCRPDPLVQIKVLVGVGGENHNNKGWSKGYSLE